MYSFDPAHPAGLVVPTGELDQQVRGAVSIQIYGLNRLKLVQDRTRLLRRLEFLGDLVIDLASSITELETPAVQAALQGTPAENVASRLRLLRDRTLAEIKSLPKTMPPIHLWPALGSSTLKREFVLLRLSKLFLSA